MALIDNLVAYWKLDEASGDAADAHGSNTLTDNNTVTSAGGIINTSRQFTAANSESLSHADNSDLSTGDIDFTFQAWVYLDSTAADRVIIAKWEFGTNKEYRLAYDQATGKFLWQVRDAAGDEGFIRSNTFGTASTATWYLLHAWHDSVNNVVGIDVNAANADTSAYTFGSQDSTAAFFLGHEEGGGANYMDGRIDEVGFWKRVLTSGERTSLYNGGAGFPYPFSTGAPILLDIAHTPQHQAMVAM